MCEDEDDGGARLHEGDRLYPDSDESLLNFKIKSIFSTSSVSAICLLASRK